MCACVRVHRTGIENVWTTFDESQSNRLNRLNNSEYREPVLSTTFIACAFMKAFYSNNSSFLLFRSEKKENGDDSEQANYLM